MKQIELPKIDKKTILIIVLLIFTIYSLFNEWNSYKYQEENKQFRKEADSSKIASEKLILKVEKAEIGVKVLKESLAEAKKQTKISESKLLDLQRKKPRPIYVDNIVNCNDTIQSIYEYSIKKDSMCNVVVSNKNVEISKQDTIIKQQEIQKKDLILANSLTENANKNLENIITNNKKEIRQEKTKKNVWKATSVGLALFLLKAVIFK